MDSREYIRQQLERTRKSTLAMVEGLRDEQLTWQPAPDANHIGFLLFHTFRAEDRYFNRWLAGDGTEVWEREGWSQRWPLPDRPDPSQAWWVGNSWTPEEMHNWSPPPLAELLEYGAAVRAAGMETLRTLDMTRLPESLRPDRPEFTVAYYLQQAVIHEAQHQGQIEYIVGLMKQESP